MTAQSAAIPEGKRPKAERRVFGVKSLCRDMAILEAQAHPLLPEDTRTCLPTNPAGRIITWSTPLR